MTKESRSKYLKNGLKLFSAFLFVATFLFSVSSALAQVQDTPCNISNADDCNSSKTGLSCQLDSSKDTGASCQPINQTTNPKPVISNSNAGSYNNLGSSQITCPSGLQPANGLCLPPNQYSSGIASSQTLTDLILRIVQAMTIFAGLIAVVFIIIGGYLYMAAGGNTEQAEKGKSTITNFAIGLAIIILAYMIVTVLTSTLTGNGGRVPLLQ